MNWQKKYIRWEEGSPSNHRWSTAPTQDQTSQAEQTYEEKSVNTEAGSKNNNTKDGKRKEEEEEEVEEEKEEEEEEEEQ